MLNTYDINEFEIGHSLAPASLTQDDIVFDNYSLQNTSIITETLDYDDLGIIDFNTFDFPRNNGGGVISKYYRGRTIRLKAIVKASSGTALNSLIDEVKENLSATEGYLDIRVNDEVRRVKATVTSLKFGRQHFHVSFVPLNVVFTILEPFFYTIADQSASYIGKTGTFSEEFTNVGTAESEPTFYFIFGTTTVTALAFTNPDGTTMTIATAITTGDVLVVNAKDKTVELNGVEIDYSGVFPKFAVGSNPFTVTITGSVNVDVSVITAKNYL